MRWLTVVRTTLPGLDRRAGLDSHHPCPQPHGQAHLSQFERQRYIRPDLHPVNPG
ncbi:MAG: hypothetical protein JW818_19890 [Pirellulales bacterium]|nr:hypothetical protein [Pirellulales bacterium]